MAFMVLSVPLIRPRIVLQIRVDEHKTAMKNVKTVDSEIAEHVLGHKHQVDFKSVSVPASECRHLNS